MLRDILTDLNKTNIIKQGVRKGQVKNSAIPRKLDDTDREMLSEVIQLFEPLAIVTDILQGDYITSYLVIPQLKSAFQGLYLSITNSEL